MEPSQEPLPTSTSKIQNSLLTEKSLPNLRPGPGKRLPWESLKVDYLSGDIMDVAEWGREKGISQNTLEKNTVGWRDDYGKRQKALAQKALARSNKQVSALASRFRAGRTLVVRSMREFSKRNLSKVAPKHLADIAKIGADIQANIEDKGIQEAIEKLQNQIVGTSVTVTQGKGEDAVRTEIKIIAGNISRGRVDRLGRKSAVLGTSEHPDGEQQAV